MASKEQTRETNTMSSRRTSIPAVAGTITVVCTTTLGLLASNTALAQSPNAAYAGKQIRMVIASGAGGGYDAYGRALARYIGKYIPGNPGLIDQKMPGA